MTKKQIAKSYIEIAEKCILEGKKDNFDRFFKRLIKHYLHNGVCCFVTSNLEYNKQLKYISNQKYYDGSYILYWTTTPRMCINKKEAIQCLQYRINILKTWL